MKLNKKGFTLIELLAVIVILLAISVIAIPSISAAIERSKNKTLERKKDVIESYAEIYYDKYMKNTNKNSFCVDVSELKKELNLDDSETNDGEFNGGSVEYNSGEFVYQDRLCP